MKHNFVRIPREGYRCTVCGWFWRGKSNTSCPGVKRYEWGKAPENLKTEAQLRKLKLKPAVDPNSGWGGYITDGYVWLNEHVSHYLYDVSKAVPLSTEEIEADKKKARRQRRKDSEE